MTEKKKPFWPLPKCDCGKVKTAWGWKELLEAERMAHEAHPHPLAAELCLKDAVTFVPQMCPDCAQGAPSDALLAMA